MADEECRDEDYSKLSDVRISLGRASGGGGEEGGGGFCLCFWIYLSSSARPSSVILRQISLRFGEGVPFLALNEENKLMLFPLMILHEEAPSSKSSLPWSDMPHVSASIECSLEKWIQIGCEVTREYLRLHIDGNLVAESNLTSLSGGQQDMDNLRQISLVGNDGKLEAYVYNVQLLPLPTTIKHQYVKPNAPVKLSIDNISDGLEEGGDGVWSIVGGKASCRRNFSLEVVLSDAFGQPVHKEMEIVASLVYADNGVPVEKSRDVMEAPLLISCDGTEYPSSNKPVPLIRGRATFKLKMSQLSSKSDNRLFRVSFHVLRTERYPFLEAYSRPIRCISRNRSSRPSGHGKRSIPATSIDELHSLQVNYGPGIIQNNKGCHLQACNHTSPEFNSCKLLKTESDGYGMAKQDEKALKTSLELRSNDVEGTDSEPSDSDSVNARKTASQWRGDVVDPLSDAMIFRYCIEGTYERSILLKEVVASASDEDMINFAEQVCLFSGCSHHRNQILTSKQLIQEGSDTWITISRNNNRVLWRHAVPEIIRKFMCIARSANRGLSGQDLEVLQGIAGCGPDLGREEFDRLWYWLCPIAFSLSKDKISKMWECMSPKWIEGLITKEEAENALKDQQRLQRPGTFVLRFPTSRSWPHPDAGSLVVTYVGSDSVIHHKLLSLGFSDTREEEDLRELLLEEPELSRLGRRGMWGKRKGESGEL